MNEQQTAAVRQALEALDFVCMECDEWTEDHITPAITALRHILTQDALDKKAENARELGLDYEPAGGTQVSKVWWDGDKLMAKPIPLSEVYKEPEQQPAEEPVAWMYRDKYGNLHESSSPTVPPDSFPVYTKSADQGQSRYCPNCEALGKQVMALKVCLETERGFREQETDKPANHIEQSLEMVEHPPLTAELNCVCGAVWEWRNRSWELEQQPYKEPVAWMDREGDVYKKEPPENWCPPHTALYAQPAAWVGLTDDETMHLMNETAGQSWGDEAHIQRLRRAIEAKLREKNGGRA